MIKKYTHKGLMWVDVESPSKEEVKTLIREYNIHPLVGNELLSPTVRSRVETHDAYIYLILHFPTIIHSHGGKSEQEIDFIIGKDFIITIHYDFVDILHEFEKLSEVGTPVNSEDTKEEHGGYLFFAMIKGLYKNIGGELELINNSLTQIENNIFKGREHDMVREISTAGRRILNFKRGISSHKSMFGSFEESGKNFFGDAFSYHLRSISEEYYRIAYDLQNTEDIHRELRITNDSLLDIKTTDIMRVLTIMAFVTFPLSLFASLFGMNTKYLPFVGGNYDFWIIIGIMILATLCFFSFFKYKKWL